MTPRQLRYFIEIARAKSFTRAAGILHVAQPALSRQIQQLEDDLSVKLFVRTDAGVLLTEAGELLLERAPNLLAQYQSVREEVSAHAAQPTGKLLIGMPPSLFDMLTISFVLECSEQYPGLEISVTEAASTQLHEAVFAGQLDLAVVSTRESVINLNSRFLIQEQMLLLSAPGQGLGAPISIDDLQDVRLASTYWPNAMRMVVEDALAKAGIRPKWVFESTSSRLLMKVAESGLARTILPYSAAAQPLLNGQLSANPIEDMTISWMLIHGRHRSTRGIESAVALISEIARKRVESGQWPGAALAAAA